MLAFCCLLYAVLLCVHAFTSLGCCAERYEQWILSDPLAFLWQVIAVTSASEPLLAWCTTCVFHTVQCLAKALPSQSFPEHNYMLQF